MEFQSSAPGEGQEDRLQPPRRILGSAAPKEDDETPKIVAAGLATPGADVEKKRNADADATSPGKNKKAMVQMKMSGKTGFELDENGSRLITLEAICREVSDVDFFTPFVNQILPLALETSLN